MSHSSYKITVGRSNCNFVLSKYSHISAKAGSAGRGRNYTARVNKGFNISKLDALFIKSGAAPSYFKRGSSIFRIRSETAPIGLMKNVDAEKIRVEIKSGDIVIMLSDGVCTSVEDSAWLISHLSNDPPSDMEEYAKEIVRLASKRSGLSDDVTVSVVKITAKE